MAEYLRRDALFRASGSFEKARKQNGSMQPRKPILNEPMAKTGATFPQRELSAKPPGKR
jgi:hypothetical protein